MPVSLGQALGQGIQGMQETRQNAMMNQMRQAQMGAMKQQQEDALRKRQALMQFREQLPPEMRNMFDVDPQSVLSMLKPKEPQYKEVGGNLVEIGPSGAKSIFTAPEKAPEGMRLVDGQLVPIPGYVQMKSQIAAAGRPSVNVNQGYEKAFDKQLAELDAKRLGELTTKADSARNLLQTINRMEKMNPDVYSGGGASARMATVNLLQGMGINVGDPKKLAMSQAFDSDASKLVLDSLGGSLGAGTSNADVSFIQKTVPQLAHSKEARQQMFNWMRDKALRTIKQGSDARAHYEKKGNFKDWVPERQIVRTGTANGRKVVEYDDGSIDYAD
jgi:hypothetical protein